MQDLGIKTERKQKRIGLILGILLLFTLSNLLLPQVRGQLGDFTRMQDVGQLKYLTAEYNNTQTGLQFKTNSTETYDFTTSETGVVDVTLLISPLNQDSRKVRFLANNNTRQVSTSTNEAIVVQNRTELFLGNEKGNPTIDSNVGELGTLFTIGQTSTFHYAGQISSSFQGSSIDVLVYQSNLEFIVTS